MEFLIRWSASLATVLLWSCGHTNDSGTLQAAHVRPRYIEKPPSSYQDTLKIKVEAAVFFCPDSVQLEKVKDTLDTSVYKAIMHDYFYQVRNGRKVVRESRPALTIIDAQNYRYLLFINRDNSRKCIDLNTKGDLYGILLFDGKKDPVLVDMPNIKTALSFYFKDQ